MVHMYIPPSQGRNSRHNQQTEMWVIMLRETENLSVFPKVLGNIAPEGYNFNTDLPHREKIQPLHPFISNPHS